jgi:acetylornithine/succinyldiaminopimelate/putrescine aminotransferase
VIRVTPPLNIGKTDIEECARRLEASLARVQVSVRS